MTVPTLRMQLFAVKARVSPVQILYSSDKKAQTYTHTILQLYEHSSGIVNARVTFALCPFQVVICIH